MAFFKFRARGPQGAESRPSAATAVPPAESIEAMRRRARHRLLGAAVLVLVGVIGFPLLFDTQPRPVPVDIPIEIPDRDKVKPLAVPAAPVPGAVSAGRPREARVAGAPVAGGMITEAADGSEIEHALPVPEPAPTPQAAARPEARSAPAKPEAKPASKPDAKAEPRPLSKPEHKAETRPERKTESKPDSKPERKAEPKPADPKPETKTARKPEPKPETKAEAKVESKAEAKPAAAKPASTANDGARARALLEGKPSDAAAAASASSSPSASGDETSRRFVVQVGAFADADKARETRQKLEGAGLRASTHVTKTADGERTRVRLGPFASRAEADRAASRVKGLSLPAAVIAF